MSTLKTTNLLQKAFARASVRNTETAAVEQAQPSTRSINALATSAFAIVFTAAATLTSAPAQAQTYQSSQGYSVSSPNGLTGRVVGVSYYVQNSGYEDEMARRNAAIRRDAQNRSANLLGSLVYSMTSRALSGRTNNEYVRGAANIGSSVVSQVASSAVYSRPSRVNGQGWDGNIRSMGEHLSLVTVDINYGNGRMERIQIRQPAVYSEGLASGDEVVLRVQNDGRNRSILAIETERSRRGYRPR